MYLHIYTYKPQTYIYNCRLFNLLFTSRVTERRRPWHSEDKILMSGVGFFCSPTHCLQPNCALDKWRDTERAKEAAIKINYLDTHMHTHTHTHTHTNTNTHTHTHTHTHTSTDVSKAWRYLCVWLCMQRGMSVFKGALLDSNPILLNLHPLSNLCLSFYRLAVTHSPSSNYCIAAPRLSCISSEHSALNYAFYPFFPFLLFLCSSHDCTLLAVQFFFLPFLFTSSSISLSHHFPTVSP